MARNGEGLFPFMVGLQEGRLEQAQDALRQIRAAGSRRSKEAFGGMRAMLFLALMWGGNASFGSFELPGLFKSEQ